MRQAISDRITVYDVMRYGLKLKEDKNTIKRFVAYLRENGHLELKIDRWPDDDNSTTPDIDAIAGPFAIEHTSIDTFPNQRKYEDWFLKAIDNLKSELESELAGQLTFNLLVTFGHEDFTQRQNWREIRDALKRFIREDVSHLGWGGHELDKVPGIPFTVCVKKSSQPPFCLWFRRSSPRELSPGLPSSRVNRRLPLPDYFRVQLDKKAKKLVPYKHCGKTTMLLIESGDYAFMHAQIMLSWIKEAFPTDLPDGVEQIWYATRYNDLDFDFKDFTSEIRRSY